jgi:hypothetical protein
LAMNLWILYILHTHSELRFGFILLESFISRLFCRLGEIEFTEAALFNPKYHQHEPHKK